MKILQHIRAFVSKALWGVREPLTHGICFSEKQTIQISYLNDPTSWDIRGETYIAEPDGRIVKPTKRKRTRKSK